MELREPDHLVEVGEAIEPIPKSALAFWPVGRAVGNPGNDGPS